MTKTSKITLAVLGVIIVALVGATSGRPARRSVRSGRQPADRARPRSCRRSRMAGLSPWRHRWRPSRPTARSAGRTWSRCRNWPRSSGSGRLEQHRRRPAGRPVRLRRQSRRHRRAFAGDPVHRPGVRVPGRVRDTDNDDLKKFVDAVRFW